MNTHGMGGVPCGGNNESMMMLFMMMLLCPGMFSGENSMMAEQ